MSRFAIESTNGTRRVRWYAIVALILAPLLLAGVVILAVNNTTSRLDTVTAAIVNNDEGTKIDGQNVPLGRQLTAGLVAGTDDAELGNYTWVLSDEADAAAGLADGSYTAVVTIPENFSKDATSFANAETATQARIGVTTSDKSRVADGVISTFIANTAASIFGTELSKSYLDGIYVGFNTLNDQLGEAADGAKTLADGSEQSAAGAKELATGASGLATGTAQLADGLDQLADGTSASASGAQQLASGVDQYVGGVGTLAGGLSTLSEEVAPLPDGVSELATGVSGLSSSLGGIAQLAAANPTMTLAELDAAFTAQGASLDTLAAGAAQTAAGTKKLAKDLPELTGGISKLAGGAKTLASSGKTVAGGVSDLASGLGQLASGTSASADGAQTLASGTTTFADGVDAFADGSAQLADGTTKIADGLQQAVDGIPTYSKSDRATLADVVTAPVSANVSNIPTLIAKSALPLLVSLALWFGAFAVYLVMQAASRRALTSRRSSLAIAATSYLPGLIVGVIQGIAVAALAQFSLQLDALSWFGLAVVAALAGASFAAVIQGLVALFGNAGRLVAAVAAAIALAAGLISTAPAFLLGLAEFLPTAAASTAVSAIISGTGGAGGAIGALVLWALFGFALSAAAVIRRRTVGVRQLSSLSVG